ncbi:hypothetical protein AJ87_26645 [Rhizobium yanglingense]|nr:hypothetical protein AJ87_26645 [Rhizobium yanglingense]
MFVMKTLTATSLAWHCLSAVIRLVSCRRTQDQAQHGCHPDACSGPCAPLLKALLVDDGDASLAVKLISYRFADAVREGKQLEMYEHEGIGRPAVALHLAVRSEILPHS